MHSTLTKRELGKKQRALKILDAAETVFFKEGQEEATMDDVAEEANVSKATLYVYFKSKDELFLAIAKRGHVVLQQMFQDAVNSTDTGMKAVREIGVAFFKFSREYRHYYKFTSFFELKHITEVSEEAMRMLLDTMNILEESIERGKKDGSIKSHVDARVTAKVLWGMALGQIHMLNIKGSLIEKQTGVEQNVMINSFFDIIEESLSTEGVL